MSVRYVPRKGGQFEPRTSTSPKDCVPAGVALLVDRATVGAIRTDHADVRKASGVPGSRGLTYGEAKVAALKVTKAQKRPVVLEPSYGNFRPTVRDTVAGGEAVGCSIDTAATINTKRATNRYVGPHTIFLVAYLWWDRREPCECELETRNPHAEFTVDDPGTTYEGFEQWSADLVYRAAERRTGGNGINLLVAPDTEGVEWTALAGAQVRSLPSYSRGRKVGKLVTERKYRGGRTENGDRWKRADGTYADGWVHIEYDGQWNWAKARALAQAAA